MKSAAGCRVWTSKSLDGSNATATGTSVVELKSTGPETCSVPHLSKTKTLSRLFVKVLPGVTAAIVWPSADTATSTGKTPWNGWLMSVEPSGPRTVRTLITTLEPHGEFCNGSPRCWRRPFQPAPASPSMHWIPASSSDGGEGGGGRGTGAGKLGGGTGTEGTATSSKTGPESAGSSGTDGEAFPANPGLLPPKDAPPPKPMGPPPPAAIATPQKPAPP